MIFPHRLTVYPSIVDVDGDGNEIRRPGPVGVPVDGWLKPQPGGATEDPTAPQTAEARYLAYLAGHCPALDAFARLEYAGTSFELVGEAQRFTNPDGSVDFWCARVRRA